MGMKPIAPVLVGRGMAGQAILKSLAIASQMDPELNILPARLVQRGDPPAAYRSDQAANVLFIANPSGLHAQLIIEGSQHFSAIAADKPVCVRPEEIAPLRNIRIPVTVFHGYRVMWGTRTIKEMIDSGELGDVFSFESRYWQSSSAQAALSGAPEKRPWKNDLNLNGPFDSLIDLGSHVVDICLYLLAEKPLESRGWTLVSEFRSFASGYARTPVPKICRRKTSNRLDFKNSSRRHKQFRIYRDRRQRRRYLEIFAAG